MDIAAHVSSLGGFAATGTLRTAGFSEQSLTRAVRAGRVRRVRRGWYTTRDPADPEYRAVRIGGRLTGRSALAAMGAWMLDPPRVLHVAVAENAARLRMPRTRRGIAIHWEARRDDSGTESSVGLREALVRVVLDEDLETAVSCLDWALSTGRLDRFGFEEVMNALPRTARAIRDWVDEGSQSVLETVARVRVRVLGFAVRSQVRVGDLNAIDLVVEDDVALELDGREHHELNFEADRRKDLQITIEGRHSIRVTPSMLRDEWPDVVRAIGAALAARRLGDAGNSGNAPPHPRGVKHATGAGAFIA